MIIELLGKQFRSRKAKLQGMLLLSATAFVGSVFAEPASVKLGETDLIPSLRISFFSDDNIFADSTDARDETGIRIAPKVTWLADYGLTVLEARYSGEYGSSGISATDYTDHTLAFTGSTEFSSRSRGRVSLSYERGSEKPGRGLLGLNGVFNQNDKVNQTDDIRFGLNHRFGAYRAKGNLITGIRYRDLSYEDRSDSRIRPDFTELTPYAIFSLRLTGATRATLEMRYRTFDYDQDENDRDQIDVFLGAEWEESEKFGGSARIGSLNYSYPNASRSDGDDLGIEVGGFYRPTSFSTISLNFERTVYNLDAGAAATGVSLSNELGLRWEHEWSSRFSHAARLSREMIERSCAGGDDVEVEGGFEIKYSARRWLGFGADVLVENRSFDGCDIAGDADIDEIDFDRTTFSLFVDVSL